MPESIPAYTALKPCRIIDYSPGWKKLNVEDAAELAKGKQGWAAKQTFGEVESYSETEKKSVNREEMGSYDYDFADFGRTKSNGCYKGMSEASVHSVLGMDDDADDEI